jgi:hypothetical protein
VPFVEEKQRKRRITLIRNFAIEMALYGILLFAYFFLVLRYLDQPLVELYQNNLWKYAFVAILVISAQAVLLDWVVNFFIDLLGLHRLD